MIYILKNSPFTVYNPMVFHIFTKLCNHHHYIILEHFQDEFCVHVCVRKAALLIESFKGNIKYYTLQQIYLPLPTLGDYKYFLFKDIILFIL